MADPRLSCPYTRTVCGGKPRPIDDNIPPRWLLPLLTALIKEGFTAEARSKYFLKKEYFKLSVLGVSAVKRPLP
jgi:hypothetical protein